MKKTPVIFVGHGSPMLAIDENDLTREMQRIGADILNSPEKPKAILAVSAHWFAPGTYIQSAEKPRQVYDMYGFPEELYQLQYPVKGYAELTKEVCCLLGDDVSINDSWGIDHGTWSVMVHMFPDASIPVVQLSVNGNLKPEQCVEIGRKLAPLREQGYLKGDVDAAIHYQDHENAAYSVPTPDHYMPLLYCLGAAGDDPATVFNNTCTMGSLSMAGFIWA